MGKSKIEWTDVTDNIFVVADIESEEQRGWICAKKSTGCKNCYAEAINTARRFSGNGLAYRRPFRLEENGLKLHFKRGIVDGWQRQRKPEMHFINSMSDTFGDWIDREWIFYMLDGMAAAPMQTFQVLTKYHQNMLELVNEWVAERGVATLPANIWLMVTAENQEMANERIKDLYHAKAAVKGVSIGPMIGAVNLSRAHSQWYDFIDWVVLEGESGKNARPMHLDWVLTVRDQCKAHNVPLLFKQWGEWIPLLEIADSTPYTHKKRILADDGYVWRMVYDVRTRCLHYDGSFEEYDNFNCTDSHDGMIVLRVGKKRAGRELEGWTHSAYPHVGDGGNDGK